MNKTMNKKYKQNMNKKCKQNISTKYINKKSKQKM